MNWKEKTILITGAGGFIGSHLTERLVELGANVKAMIHYNAQQKWGWLNNSNFSDEINVIAGDICDRDSIQHAMEGVDIVFHLAALIGIPYSYHAPASYVRTNIEGTLNILLTARENNIERIIHTSTSEVYGTARYVPINEEHPIQGQSPYSATKIAADKLAEAFYLSFGVPITTIRPFNTFGPRQSARAIIPTIITQVLTRPSLHLGNLESTRDFNFIADTVEGFIKIAESYDAIGQVINIGSGEEISVGELAKTIMKITDREIPIISEEKRLRPEKSEVNRLCADNTKAKNILEWRPQYELKEGLIQTIKWMEDNLEIYKLDSYTI
jgi:dTDP-glucose 4,6-dehydratase